MRGNKMKSKFNRILFMILPTFLMTFYLYLHRKYLDAYRYTYNDKLVFLIDFLGNIFLCIITYFIIKKSFNYNSKRKIYFEYLVSSIMVITIPILVVYGEINNWFYYSSRFPQMIWISIMSIGLFLNKVVVQK